MKKINNIIEKNIKKILSTFFILQPILDVITAISLNYLKTEITIGSITRFLFIIFCIYYIFFIKQKKENIKKISIIILYCLLFSATIIIKKDTSALFYELKNTINTFYFPIILITLIDIFKEYKIKINIKNFVYMYTIYTLLIVIPNITNTGFMSYSHSKLGNTGWFLSANTVGNILSITLPLIIYYILKEKNHHILKIYIIISSIFIFCSIGTKSPLLSLIICIITTLAYFITQWIKNKKYKLLSITIILLIISIVSSIMILPKTSFYKNIQIHKEYLKIENNIDIFKNYELIDHFIFSQRLTFLSNTSNNYKKADITEKLLGIGYIENYGTNNVNIKTIEIDYFDILYRQGIIGFTIFAYSILSSLKQKNKIKNVLLKKEIKTSFLLIILLSLFTGHIITSPSVSIFVTLIIICYQGGLNEKNN